MFIIKSIAEFGEAPAMRYKSKNPRLRGFFEKHMQEFSVDEITWNDLSMDEIFDRINYCESSAGEEYLYYLLRSPLMHSDDDFSLMEKEIEALDENEEERNRLKRLFNKIGKNNKYSIYDYLGILDRGEKTSNRPHYLALILMVVFIIVMAFWNFTIGFLGFLGVIGYNIVSYFRIRSEIEPYLVTFSYVCRHILYAREIYAANSSIFKQEEDKLKSCVDKLSGFQKGAWILMSGSRVSGSGNPFDIIIDYVRMMTHADLIQFNKMFAKLKGEMNTVDELIAIMGRMDAIGSFCYFRKSLKGKFCKPEFLQDNDNRYEIKNGYHILVEKPVDNSVNVSGSILLTGSNASGKSTFLKMCAVNSLLAQTIHTALSDGYSAPKYRIYSSMALRDALRDGDSYYMVEIKSLKRILDASESDESTPVLCFIDEVLRGTNTIERISASAEVLDHFACKGVKCFAATHDLELSSLLKEKYANYHFEGIMEGDDVRFDYLLKEGPATTRNAIKLLKKIGYDSDIVTRAEKVARSFEETGVWSLQ